MSIGKFTLSINSLIDSPGFIMSPPFFSMLVSCWYLSFSFFSIILKKENVPFAQKAMTLVILPESVLLSMKKLICRFCQCQLPSNRSVDICIRCCNPSLRPTRPPRNTNVYKKFNVDRTYQRFLSETDRQIQQLDQPDLENDMESSD